MRRFAAAAILFVLSAVPELLAHNYLPETPGSVVTSISDVSVSRAAYRVLSQGDQVDVYEFTAKKGQELYVQMTIPYLECMQGFAPGFVLVYAGEGPAEFTSPQLQKGRIVDALSGESPAIGVEYDGSEPLVFDEPFTGTRYWIRQTLTVSAPADGVYRILVYSPRKQTGKYVLAPGRKEQFGFGDILTLPAVRWKVREFCEEPLWPDALLWTVVGAAVVGGIAFGVYKVIQR